MKKWLYTYVCAVFIVIVVIAAQNIWDLDKNAWASWAQAIGSIFAVAAAALVPFVHSRSVARERKAAHLRMVLGLVRQAARLFEELEEGTQDESSLLGYQHFGLSAEWTELHEMLDSIPLWDIAEHELAEQIGHLKGSVRHGMGLAGTITVDDLSDPGQVEDIETGIAACKFVTARAENVVAKLLCGS